MVKPVAAEETQLKSVEDRLFRSSIQAEVGVVVGKLSASSERGYVYDLIPTPPTDGGGPACSLKLEGGGRDDRKKGSKGGKSSAEATHSLFIDGEWIAEHARQVSRMLLGGMSVVGMYIWSSEASYKATSAAVLSQVIRGVAHAAPGFESDSNERLLIHISYSPRRWACRSCLVTSGDLRPCDFKMSKLLSLLQTYRCLYKFDIRLPIFQTEVSVSTTCKNALRNGISCHAKELERARALVDGNLVNDDKQFTSEGLHNVELLLPFKNDVYLEGSSDEITGLVVFRGSICASAYLGPKEPLSQALSDLKSDIIKSLRSRLDIVLDEAADKLDMDTNDEGKESSAMLSEDPRQQLRLVNIWKPHTLAFPRRILVPWLSGTYICDYLLPSETFEDLKDHCREMMSLETPLESSPLLELEKEATPVVSLSFWNALLGNSQFPTAEHNKPDLSTEEENFSEKPNSCNFSLLLAVLVLIVAVAIAGAFAYFAPAKAGH
ncbi:hypothetical protein AXF42_Ash002003 [Apostasia shenzhenica]|uniref:Protein odr-4 like n=1 Tax=Apostasia shenzhenica TaxID=1088818 RepID=A0A2I0ABU6_9ASPA|nr:hypothetical protein AXF42_Ash002003 [Apostasia shenzhenica]